MTPSKNVTIEDLPYIFQLLQSENEVMISLEQLNDNINQINYHKKELNLEYLNQQHLIRNIVVSIFSASAITLFFHISFIRNFILIFSVLIIYQIYQRKQIKSQTNLAEQNLNHVISQKNEIQNQLNRLIQKNEKFTENIPEKFRNPNSIVDLFNLLHYGQADNLKEAYHLLDLEYRHQEHMGILRAQNSLLAENNQIAYQQLNHLQGLTALQEQQLTAIRELSTTARSINSTLEQTDKRVEGLENHFVPKYKRKS